MLIPPAHVPGRHCASSALCNLATFHGLRWSEAMCCGLGAGLGVLYIRSKSPSRMVHVRSADLEEQFFIRIGLPLTWDRFDTPEQSQERLIHSIDAGVPAIIQTDIFYLPYYRSGTHFPGHVITVWGYDLEKKVFLVTDTERPEIIEVPFTDMARARFWKDAFFDIKGNCMAPASLASPADMANTLQEAIVYNSRVIMDAGGESRGLAGLQTFHKELDLWAGFDDWQWTFRFAYQVIEKRGTGGGGFRLMYRDFLEEAQAYLPKVRNLNLPRLMGASAAAWSALAVALKEASKRQAPDIRDVRACLEGLIQVESTYHQAALGLGVGPLKK